MNLSDLSSSQYLASDDYTVGQILPVVEIARIEMADVPVPNSTKKNSKAVAWFKGATKGWCINKTVARQIAKVIGETKNIDKTWVGAKIQLVVVGDVRRPDGTRGNAFRLHQAWAADKPATTTPADPAKG
jgi:hypothetical protein